MRTKVLIISAFTKMLFLALIFFVISSQTSCKKDDDDSKQYILIYDGAIADKDGVKKVTQMAEEKGYEVEYISNIANLPDRLSGAKAFVIGGTQDDTGDLLKDLYNVQDDLKKYIENGGNYLGICGGAYVASKGSQWEDGYETGIKLVDIESFAYDGKYTDPQIISITWLETQRTIYYQYGPAFAKSNIPTNSTIYAYYNNENQDVAAFLTTLGKGKIILFGPHPEADSTWLIDTPEPLNANTWKETHDIFEYIFTALL